MNNISEQLILKRYTQNVMTHSKQLGRAQNHMMDIRKLGLAQIAAEISAQMLKPAPSLVRNSAVLFTREWLNEFALGDITRCLGPEFNIYKGRRSPRIPNGDLLLVSRIDQIEGKRGEFESLSSITAEFDVPVTPWFLEKSQSHDIPVSMLMEIALQPCGVLSAWLQTQLRYPEIDFFFRNLDGQITLHKEMDVRGKTITTKARLEKTVFSGSTIIQHFQFVLSCESSDFLSGQTTFGYFSEQTMAAQVGLDGGISTSPWGRKPENLEKMKFEDDLSGTYGNALPANKLRLIDRIGFARNPGEAHNGYILAERKNDPSDWYYANHFLGDPVMPGSLGVEAIVQAFRTEIMILSGSNSEIKFAGGYELNWKYRGQVLPANAKVQVDVQITEITKRDNATIYIGNANLWADDLRIYEIRNLALIQ